MIARRYAALFAILIALGCTEEPEPAAEPLPDFTALWDFQKPAETEQRFRDLLPLAEESGDLNYELQLRTQIARSLGLQRKFDQAHALLDEIDAQIEANRKVDLRLAELRSLLERGRTFNSGGDPGKSSPLFAQAWEIGREIGDDNLSIDAAHMLAIVEPPESAIPWFEKAVAVAEKTESEKARDWLGALYNNLGWTYHDQGQYEEALRVFQTALAWREEHSEPPQIRIAKWCVGRTYRSLNRLDEALASQMQLLAELDAAEEEDGYVFEELGECLLLLGRESEARPHFARAYELLSQDAWLAEDAPERLTRLREIGEGAR